MEKLTLRNEVTPIQSIKWWVILLFVLGLFFHVILVVFVWPLIFKSYPSWFINFISLIIVLPVTLICYHVVLNVFKEQDLELLIAKQKLQENLRVMEKERNYLIGKKSFFDIKISEVNSLLTFAEKIIINVKDKNAVIDIILNEILTKFTFDRVGICVGDSEHSLFRRVESKSRYDDSIVYTKLFAEEMRKFLIKCINYKSLYIIHDENIENIKCNYFKEVKDGIYVCVPLIRKDALTGIIIIDNNFSRKTIEDIELRNFMRYTHIAGLII